MYIGSNAWAYVCMWDINKYITHVYIYLCMNEYRQTWIYVHTYIYYIHACIHTCAAIEEYMSTHMYICVCLYAIWCVHLGMYICRH